MALSQSALNELLEAIRAGDAATTQVGLGEASGVVGREAGGPARQDGAARAASPTSRRATAPRTGCPASGVDSICADGHAVHSIGRLRGSGTTWTMPACFGPASLRGPATMRTCRSGRSGWPSRRERRCVVPSTATHSSCMSLPCAKRRHVWMSPSSMVDWLATRSRPDGRSEPLPRQQEVYSQVLDRARVTSIRTRASSSLVRAGGMPRSSESLPWISMTRSAVASRLSKWAFSRRRRRSPSRPGGAWVDPVTGPDPQGHRRHGPGTKGLVVEDRAVPEGIPGEGLVVRTRGRGATGRSGADG